MKTFSVVLVVVIVASVRAGPPDPQLMKTVVECKEKTGGSDADLARIMIHKKPTTEAGKCMLGCIMEGLGVVKDGKLSKDGVAAWGNSHLPPVNVADQVAAACGSISGNTCESNADIAMCFQETTIKSGVKM